MSFFPLPHRATLEKKITTARARSGQPANEYGDPVNIPKCLFFGFAGGKSSSVRKDFSQDVVFYLPPGVDIDEGDRVTNIIGKQQFEPGPFEVINVRYVTNFSGGVHHITCRLKGSTG